MEEALRYSTKITSIFLLSFSVRLGHAHVQDHRVLAPGHALVQSHAHGHALDPGHDQSRLCSSQTEVLVEALHRQVFSKWLILHHSCWYTVANDSGNN